MRQPPLPCPRAAPAAHLHHLLPQLLLVQVKRLLEESGGHLPHGRHQPLPLARAQLLCMGGETGARAGEASNRVGGGRGRRPTSPKRINVTHRLPTPRPQTWAEGGGRAALRGRPAALKLLQSVAHGAQVAREVRQLDLHMRKADAQRERRLAGVARDTRQRRPAGCSGAARESDSWI